MDYYNTNHTVTITEQIEICHPSMAIPPLNVPNLIWTSEANQGPTWLEHGWDVCHLSPKPFFVPSCWAFFSHKQPQLWLTVIHHPYRTFKTLGLNMIWVAELRLCVYVRGGDKISKADKTQAALMLCQILSLRLGNYIISLSFIKLIVILVCKPVRHFWWI